MIRLTNLADYGVVLMAEVASRADLSRTNDLVDATGLPSATVAKLMNALTRGGLLTSHRGAQGGFELSRQAAEITIADIVEAIEGPIALTQCTTDRVDDCSFEPICRVRPYWNTINDAVKSALSDVTLGTLVAETNGSATPGASPKVLESRSTA